ncbi:unnamed protein product [Thelazia callipaeda]|uniref:Neur_chan_memb domain-containing protein n=1 Tax=Thelazia callipaeda TaxID=103827 RepID=A0A0N5D2H6_THECL|nr:unnamed protein product [Thelazia callipaeda]
MGDNYEPIGALQNATSPMPGNARAPAPTPALLHSPAPSLPVPLPVPPSQPPAQAVAPPPPPPPPLPAQQSIAPSTDLDAELLRSSTDMSIKKFDPERGEMRDSKRKALMVVIYVAAMVLAILVFNIGVAIGYYTL